MFSCPKAACLTTVFACVCSEVLHYKRASGTSLCAPAHASEMRMTCASLFAVCRQAGDRPVPLLPDGDGLGYQRLPRIGGRRVLFHQLRLPALLCLQVRMSVCCS